MVGHFLFLVGAGASYGSDSGESAPPLGDKLYDALCRHTLRNGINSVDKLTLGLADAFRADFEQGMAELYERMPGNLAPLLNNMALFFLRYNVSPRSLYRRLSTVLRASRKPFVFASLNYETLLEQALLFSGYSIDCAGDALNEGMCRVIKPHGSCNFLPDIPLQVHGKIDVSGFYSSLATDIRIESDPHKIGEFCLTHWENFAPAISSYAEGKPTPYGLLGVEQFRRQYYNDVSEAKAIFILGVRANEKDQHIWKPLENFSGPIHNFGGTASEFDEWAAKNNIKLAINHKVYFDQAISIISFLIDENSK